VWLANNLRNWKVDPDRLYIGGASAGATLATVVTQMIRDRGGPKIQGQILLCPMTDMHLQTSSARENATGTNLTSEQLKWFISQYCPDTSQYNNPLVSPLRAKSLANLPPALIVTAECDPLKDDGELYAKKLKEDHVSCDVFCYPGMIHCFSIFPLDFPEKRDVVNKIKDFVYR
jgi:acetyl esterase